MWHTLCTLSPRRSKTCPPKYFNNCAPLAASIGWQRNVAKMFQNVVNQNRALASNILPNRDFGGKNCLFTQRYYQLKVKINIFCCTLFHTMEICPTSIMLLQNKLKHISQFLSFNLSFYLFLYLFIFVCVPIPQGPYRGPIWPEQIIYICICICICICVCVCQFHNPHGPYQGRSQFDQSS